MKPGKMDREIVIQRKTTTRDTSGAPIDTWVCFAEVWADVQYVTAAERFQSDAVHSFKVAKFFVRWLDGAHPDMRISFDDLLWRIEGVREIGRRDGIEIAATAYYNEAG